MNQLKVVALISGGKDSLFSILHCLANGHDVVALANLYPPQHNKEVAEDVDSFMYQTVGHGIVPIYEEALGLPLYRQEIYGDAVNADKTYAFNDVDRNEKPDETESLTHLLKRVLAAHPKINAVSSGAILSDYQRTRVESVAARLGLTSLAYLWQYPRIVTRNPRSLLEDMAAAGQEARIIKVSSGGLDSSFLWADVTDLSTSGRLLKASQRFGDLDNGAVLGEGGEYETLAIGGPASLWKGRIVIEEKDVQHVMGEAGSAHVRIHNAQFSSDPPPQKLQEDVRRPDLLEQVFASLTTARLEDRAGSLSTSDQPIHSRILDDHMISNITCEGANTAEQTTKIMNEIQARLHHADSDFDDVVYTSIILRNMADFATVNTAYAKSFKKPNPPARMTLSCAAVLPPDRLVSISVTSRKLSDPRLRHGLHVQSVSYWAPANIGPYSQAISLPAGPEDDASIVYIAGQIPLLPASMNLIVPASNNDGFIEQAVLSLQHLHRIRNTTSVRYWLHAAAFVTASDHAEAIKCAAIVRRVWSGVFSSGSVETTDDIEQSDEDFDVWHQHYGQQRSGVPWENLHNHTAELHESLWKGPAPPLHVFQVDNLPRGARVEWVAFGTTSTTPLDVDVPHYRHILDIFTKQAL